MKQKKCAYRKCKKVAKMGSDFCSIAHCLRWHHSDEKKKRKKRYLQENVLHTKLIYSA